MKKLFPLLLIFSMLALIACKSEDEKKKEQYQKIREAFMLSDAETVRQLLSDFELSPYQRKRLLETAIGARNNMDMVMCLVDNGLPLDTLYENDTLLMWALKLHNGRVAGELIKRGADVFEESYSGTPMSLICDYTEREAYYALKEYLLENEKPDPDYYEDIFGLLFISNLKDLVYNFWNEKTFKEKILQSSNLPFFVARHFSDSKHKDILDELKETKLVFDETKCYYHSVIEYSNFTMGRTFSSPEEQVQEIVLPAFEWLRKNGVDPKKAYEDNHRGMTTPAEYADFQADLARHTFDGSPLSDKDKRRVEYFRYLANFIREWVETEENIE